MIMDLPREPRDLSLEWINRHVRHPMAPFATLRIEALGEGTGFYGSLCKLTLTATDASSREVNMVGKFAASDPSLRHSLGVAGIYAAETDFYSRMARSFPVRVPEPWFCHYDKDTHETVLLLEWLDGEFGDSVRGADQNDAELAVDALRTLHRYWAEPRRLDEHRWLIQVTDSNLFRSFASIDAAHAAQAMEIIGDRLPGWVHDHAHHTGLILQSCL